MDIRSNKSNFDSKTSKLLDNDDQIENKKDSIEVADPKIDFFPSEVDEKIELDSNLQEVETNKPTVIEEREVISEEIEFFSIQNSSFRLTPVKDIRHDIKELVRIRKDHEDTIFKRRNIQPRIEFYTNSQYIKVYCADKQAYLNNNGPRCKCIEQEEHLNQSLRKVPKDEKLFNPRLINDEFTPQIMEWVSTEYKCAPCLRSSTKMIATSDFLFIFGGSNPNMSKNSKLALQDVHQFNILTRKWTKLNVDNIPASLICFSTCWDPNPSDTNLVGYIYGGAYDSEGIQMSNELYKFLIDSDGGISFEKVHVENKPSPRCGSAIIMDKTGKMYLIGGADEKEYLCDVWVLDMKMEKLSWKEIKHGCLLKGRYIHEVMMIDDKIFLIGGGDGDWSAPLDKIDVFDIKTQKFIQINTLPDENHGYPHPRQFLSAVINGTDAYIIGGLAYIKSEQGPTRSNMADTKIFSDIWKLSQIIIDGEIFYKWNKMSTSLKMALFFHASAITPEGCVYNFGGCIDAKSMYPSNKLQRFWINPPTLKQISMFKALSNNPSLIEQIQDLRQSLSMKLIRGH